MSDKIEEIRKRHEAGPHSKLPPMSDPARVEAINAGWRTFCAEADADRAFLLDLTERHREENEKLRAENDELCRAAGRTRAALSGWILASPGREDEPTHELVAAVVAEAERLRFQRSLRKLRDKP